MRVQVYVLVVYYEGLFTESFLRYIDSQGNHRVQGGPALKATQHYPALFGHSVAQLWERNRANIKRCVQHAAKLISAYNAGACVCTGR